MDDNNRKLLRMTRCGVCLLALLLAAVCAVSAILVPRTLRTLEKVDGALTTLDSLAETAEAALQAANETAQNTNKLVADNADAVSEAMEKFNSVDFDSLNKAIKDLSDIVEPLAKVANMFNR